MLTEGVPVELRTAKVRAVLAMLALHPGQVLSAERLAEGLWGGNPPPSAANTLQGYISQLRKVLGRDAIVTRAPGYLLALPADAVDVGRFERLVTQGRAALDAGRAIDAAALLKSALALWRGPALDEFTYEPFAQAEAARLEELRLVAIEELVEARLALGRQTELVAELRALIDQHPLRERLWRQLMQALYRCGRQAEALRAFSELRGHLGAELGIDPSPELQRLEEAMLLQKPELEWHNTGGAVATVAGTAASTHTLLVPRSSFVGRDEEIRELEKLTTTAAIVTVVGPGGSGKSRLVLEVARRLGSNHTGGTWLVELASVSEPALVPQEVAAAVGVREVPGRPLMESLADALDRHTLLVLDNCEHLVEAAAALVDTLARAAPTLTVLATSREPLRVDGEVLWRIPTLAVPETDSMPADGMLDYDAVLLFVERASAQGNYTWGPANAAAVARVCRRLDGLPLAIELAAARTRALSPAVIAERLDNRFELLTAGFRTALPRHQTLRATVDWSYELLTPPERVVFRRLSVFAG
ncbi:MAG: winged helix-turn-helix domain-containing protein, partial [Actinomycetota bacterium]|nr:winged helix-turn-helix domain-containing protein [Actinomycetota bacterium]